MSAKPPVVFVTQEQSRINYSQAEDYGDIVFLSLHDIPTVHTSLRASSAMKEISSKLKGYRPGIDYLLPSGSPLNIACAMLMAAHKNADTHNILKWEARAQKYVLAVLGGFVGL